MAAAFCGLELQMDVEPWPAALRDLVVVSGLYIGWFFANGAS